MDTDIRIEPITILDIVVLQDVALQAYRDHYLHLWHDGGQWYMQKSFSTGQLATELGDDNARFYLIYAGDEAVGFLKLNIDAPLAGFNAQNALELERIYLTKAASGKGAGSAVMGFVFTLARKLHKTIVWLKAMDSSGAAIAFYKKHGFETCGTYMLGFEQMKEEVRGMYVMKKEMP
jgi:GNAT superfamily N-acetyltransferase